MKNLVYNGIKFEYDDFKSENLGFAFEVELFNNSLSVAKILISKRQLAKL